MRTTTPRRNFRPAARQRARLVFVCFLAVCLGSLIPVNRVQAAGELDVFFGNLGKVLTNTSGVGTPYYGDGAEALLLQPDGKIVVAGGGPSNPGFTVVRYNVDGSLDTTFGSGGIAVRVPGTLQDAALQGDGKIVAAGHLNGQMAVARYNPDGSLDASFDGDGTAYISFGSRVSAAANAIAIQSDGKIVLAGSAHPKLAVVRLHVNGALDSSFGSGGKVTVEFSGKGSLRSTANAAAIDGQGRIVAAGGGGGSSKGGDFALARFTPSGALDSSFGSGGKVTTNFFGFDDQVFDLEIDGQGRLVAAGVAGTSGSLDGNDFAVARYNANGTLDTGFDGDGKTTTDIFGGSTNGRGVALQADGKIVVAGYAYTPDRGIRDFALVRYNTDGTRDTGFGTGGIITTDFAGGEDYAFAVVIQPADGNIVVGGTAEVNDPSSPNYGMNFALARYLP